MHTIQPSCCLVGLDGNELTIEYACVDSGQRTAYAYTPTLPIHTFHIHTYTPPPSPK